MYEPSCRGATQRDANLVSKAAGRNAQELSAGRTVSNDGRAGNLISGRFVAVVIHFPSARIQRDDWVAEVAVVLSREGLQQSLRAAGLLHRSRIDSISTKAVDRRAVHGEHRHRDAPLGRRRRRTGEGCGPVVAARPTR